MLKYRPDIDGLRAIAVGSVVLYHLRESLLPGGFVGVDIFFVISGYLISKLILTELSDHNSFSFKRFYLRRLRRLFPALFATLLLSTGLAYYLLSPSHLGEFAQSLIASIFSVSNVFFWSLTDYFDSQSSLKPLLHTWSLSVEEQFYFVWPALLVGLFAIKRSWVLPFSVVTIGLASLLLNLFSFSNHPSISDHFTRAEVQSTAFYWLPFRVFEFAIGAVLVWVKPSPRKGLAELSFMLGLSMVMASLFVINSKMSFPSSTALLPCVGAALMIASGGRHRLSWIVSNRIMVFLGLISYSLYLVHWPLIVFYKYAIGREFTAGEIVALLALSIVLATCMYRWVEQVFRKPKTGANSPNKKFVLGSVCISLLTVTVSVNAITSKGWLWRYPDDVIAQLSYQQGDYTEFFWSNMNRLEAGFADNGKPKVLVLGDSMAADFVNVLVAGKAEQELDVATIMIQENCKSLFGLNDRQYRAVFSGATANCKREHQRVLAKQDLFKQADSIVMASYYWDNHHLQYVPVSAAHMAKQSDAQIMVLGLKVQKNNGIWFLHKNVFSPNAHLLRTPPHPKTLQINRTLRLQAQNYFYFDLLDQFCNKEGCQRITKDGYVIIFDHSHISENGAKLIAKDIRQTNWYSLLLQSKAKPSG